MRLNKPHRSEIGWDGMGLDGGKNAVNELVIRHSNRTSD